MVTLHRKACYFLDCAIFCMYTRILPSSATYSGMYRPAFDNDTSDFSGMLNNESFVQFSGEGGSGLNERRIEEFHDDTTFTPVSLEFENAPTKFKNISLGDNMELVLPVRGVTSNITQCNLRQLQRSFNHFNEHVRDTSSKSIHHCRVTETSENLNDEFCWCVLIGKPPNVTLALRVYEVLETDFGTWRLTLVSETGNGSHDFAIELKEGPPELGNILKKFPDVTVGEIATLQLSVTVSSTNITRCAISHFSSPSSVSKMTITSRKDAHHQCNLTFNTNGKISFTEVPQSYPQKCTCVIQGSLPKLNVTMDIYDVTMAGDGHWCVSVTNQHGYDFADFFLTVSKAAEKTSDVNSIAVVCVVLLLVVGLAGVLKGISWVKRSRGNMHVNSSN